MTAQQKSSQENTPRRTVLITGGSGGIGSAAALAFAKAGYTIALTYHRHHENAAQTAKLCRNTGADCILLEADLSDANNCRQTVSRAKEALGHIDVLIHSAGKSHIGFFDETTEEEYDALFNINMKAAFFLSQAASRDMLHRKSGTILLISSMWGVQGASMEVAYSASKAALNGFVQALASEFAPSGIAVIGVAPGAVDTPMNGNLTESDRDQLINEIPIGRFLSPDEIAKLLLFLSSECNMSLTGQIISPTGGLVL